jgi:hypothetical protein
MIGVTLVGLALAALALRIGSRQGAADFSTSTT